MFCIAIPWDSCDCDDENRSQGIAMKHRLSLGLTHQFSPKSPLIRRHAEWM